MFTKKGSLAIGTWPTPEKGQGFRFENFFLDNLHSIGAIDRQTDLKARFDLNIELVAGAVVTDGRILGVDSIAGAIIVDGEILGVESLAGVIIHNGRILGVESLAGGVTTDGRILLVESLVSNGVLAPELGMRWRRVLRNAGGIEFAPSLFRQIQAKDWSHQKALEILDHSFSAVSGVAYPIPGSDLDKHCREHPEDPLCWVIGTKFNSYRGMRLASELILVSLLNNENLLTYEQTRAIFDTIHKGLTSSQGIKDLSIPQGVIIVDGLDLQPKQRAAMISSLGINRVGLIDPDSPWAEICAKENPPPICKFINTFPIAMALTTQLVKVDIWSQAEALDAWNQLNF